MSRWLACCLAGAALLAPVATLSLPPAPKAIRALVVTGGHDFDRPAFDALWNALPGIHWREVSHPNAHAELSRERPEDFDVLVLYDMHQDISEAAKADMIALLKRGKGLIVWHHALADYQDWDEALRIFGGRFRLNETVRDGAKRPPSTWKDDVPLRVSICDPKHPVTRELVDYDIVDETYGDLDVLPVAKPLLRTTEPTSHPVIAWAHRYGRSRVVGLQSGHGRSAFEHPSFRRLLRQAIVWTSGLRDPQPRSSITVQARPSPDRELRP